MLISTSLPSAINSGRSTLLSPNRQHNAAESNRAENTQPVATGQNLVSSDRQTSRTRFVMPDNATSRRGQIALQEYQMIQNEGEPELVNRLDVRV